MEKNINSLEEYLSFFENHTSKIAKELRKEGYEIAGHMELKVPKEKQPPYNMVGILRKKEPIQKKLLGIRYNMPQREDCIGKVWTDNREINGIQAVNDKRWLVEIYGQDNYLEVAKLVKKIASPYKIKISKFVHENPREEAYLSDIVV
jgi:hypothetical protein